MSTAREQIFATLRSMPGQVCPPLPDVLTTENATATSLEQRIIDFTAMLEKVGAPVDVTANASAATTRIKSILEEHGVSSLALSDADLTLAIAKNLPDHIELLHDDTSREALLASDAGLSTAQWGIAETGTLILVSRHERHRLATLLPGLHIALLPASQLLATLGDAFARIAPNGQPDGQTITFVTGPSRTADIELELVVGVHGPKALHVLILLDL